MNMNGAAAAFSALSWLDETPDPVSALDLQGRHVFVNAASAAALGHSREECVGKSHRELGMTAAGCETWQRAIERAASGAHPAFEFRFEAGGQEQVHHVRLVPYREGGRVTGVVSVGRDITSTLRRTEGELDDVKRRMAALMDAAPVGISFSDDASCHRVSGNDTVARQFEWQRDANMSASAPDEDAPGRRIRFFAAGRELSAHDLPLQRAAAENRLVPPMELEVILPSGRRWICEGSAAPVRDEKGHALRAVAVTVDITARKEAERNLVAAHAKLRDADRRKDEFLAILSHELRNPLTPITNALLLLDRVPLDSDPARRSLAVIRRQVQHIGRLVDDLLDVNRIASGKVQVRREPTDLVAVTGQIAGDLADTFRERGLELDLCLPAEEIWVEADPTRMAQAIGNLLHNAAKFTPRGGHVRVTVSRSTSGAAVEVADDGLGIEPALLDHVFDAFAQAKRTEAQSRGGLGLGLALVRGIVALHGGTVNAKSDGPDRGSTFTVELPSCTAPTGNGERGEDSADGHALHVLVIDDSKDSADSLRFLLESFGHVVDVAYTGGEGVRRARSSRPDAVICDIGLPDMDGYEVGRRICAEPGRKPLLVALTGFGMVDDRKRAVDAGFDSHVTKPADIESIRDLLERAGRSRPDG